MEMQDSVRLVAKAVLALGGNEEASTSTYSLPASESHDEAVVVEGQSIVHNSDNDFGDGNNLEKSSGNPH